MYFAGNKTCKSALLEFYASHGTAATEVPFHVSSSGSSHAPFFTCEVVMPPAYYFKGQTVEGTGRSKKAAEHDAAGRAIDILMEAKLMRRPPGDTSSPEASIAQLQELQLASTPIQNPASSMLREKATSSESSHRSSTSDDVLLNSQEESNDLLGDALGSLSLDEARQRLAAANVHVRDLQAQLADLQTARIEDRARLKFAAQSLLAQGAGEKYFQQELLKAKEKA